ncbi:hypothetical protein IMSAGC011_02091 [Lachnospiraceae bacterium]|nr:hypothetical protein IMSAGC011_02091 [Lachnospiraceae bacterium]
MKHFNLGKLLLTLALVILIQNGTVIIYNTTGDYSEEGGISTFSDKPYLEDNYS